MLAGQRQSLPAGGKQDHVGTRLQKCVGELGGSLNQVFAVVEDEERPPWSQKGRYRQRGRPFPVHGQSEHGGDLFTDLFGVIQRRQFDKPHAVRKAR